MTEHQHSLANPQPVLTTPTFLETPAMDNHLSQPIPASSSDGSQSPVARTARTLTVWGCPAVLHDALRPVWSQLNAEVAYRPGVFADKPTVRLPGWLDSGLEAKLMAALPPLKFVRKEERASHELVVQFPQPGRGRAWSALLTADSSAALATAEQWLALVGIHVGARRLEAVPNGLHVCLENQAVGDESLVQWLARRMGGSALSVERATTPGREPAAFWVSSAQLGVIPAASELRLRVETDDPDAAAPIVDQLAELGLQTASVGPLGRRHRAEPTFGLFAEPFLPAVHDAQWERWRAAIHDGMKAAGVDVVGLPLQTHTESNLRGAKSSNPAASLEVQLVLPIAAALRGTMRPYAGPYPQRFELQIGHQTGDEAVALAVRDALREAGFGITAVEYAGRKPRSSAFQLHSRELQAEPTVLEVLTQAVERVWQQEQQRVQPEGAPPAAVPGWRSLSGVGHLPFLSDGSERHELILPALHASPAEPLHALAEYNVSIYSSDLSKAREVSKRLRDAVSGLQVRSRPLPRSRESELVVNYGGCAQETLEALSAWLQNAGYGQPVLNKEWHDEDMDVHVLVPAEVAATQQSAPDPFGDWGRPRGQGQGFVAVTPTEVRIGRVTLQRRIGPRHPLAPALEAFDAMALDDGTRQVLQHVADAVAARAPCLLEGPTAATKTSGVLFAAALLGQPVLRVNLSAQTDASELIGQFQPQPGGGFVWVAGAALRAIQEGFWLVLDEVNLAPPQILERLNSLLEVPASLTVAERDLAVWGPGGQPIHPGFRVFGTMNPAEYAGRSAQSAAGKDRWLYQLQVQAPDLAAMTAMLEQAVFGQQPQAAGWGAAVVGGWQPAVRCPLPDNALTRDLLGRLAQLQVSVTAAANSEGGLGADRREPYVFTRRGLLALLQLVSDRVREGEELETAMRAGLRLAFVDRVAPQHRAALALLMDAAGLGPSCWRAQPARVCDDPLDALIDEFDFEL